MPGVRTKKFSGAGRKEIGVHPSQKSRLFGLEVERVAVLESSTGDEDGISLQPQSSLPAGTKTMASGESSGSEPAAAWTSDDVVGHILHVVWGRVFGNSAFFAQHGMLQARVGWRDWAKTLVGICAQTSARRIKHLLNSFKTPMPNLSNVKFQE
jgi:hypothetical protein